VNPAALYQGSGGGEATVSASFDFTDLGGDLANVSLVIKNGAGATILSITEPITDVAGATHGSLLGQVTINTIQADTFAFQITASDKLAATSPALNGTFRVAPAPYTALPAMPTPRNRVATATVGGLIYVLGGGDFLGNHFTTVEAFDPATGLWSARASMATPRDPAVAGVIGGKIYVAAGGLTRTTEVFDPATGLWATVAPLPTERQGAAGCELGGRLYVVGGNQGMDLANVEAYDPALDTWITCAPLPVARSWASACALNGKLYVVGGYAGGTVNPWLAQVDVYDPATNTWSSAPPIPFTLGVYQHTVLALGGQVVVAGGANAEPALATVYRFDPAGGTWTQGAPLPRPLAQHGAGSAAGKGYFFDGLGTLAYDPAKDLGPLN
jgi:N-acetylneuraminic acid mutarotase